MAESRKLTGIEACRGVAATSVVLYHAARHLDHVYGSSGLMSIFQFGHAGVDLFFVISGFIILFVHYDDIGKPGHLRRYISRRLTRILPIYWLALALTILLGLAGGRAFPAISDVAWSATLLPSHDQPLLGVAWTLQFEIIFYALFCLLILHRRTGLAVLALWLGWIALAQIRGGVGGGLPPSLYGAYNLEFFLGMGAAAWLKNYRVPAPRAMLAAGIVWFAATAVAENLQQIDGYAPISRLLYGFPSALIVLSVAAADHRGSITVPAALRRLGSASYSIYLFQFIFIGIVWKLWLAAGLDGTTPHVASFPLLASAGVGGGLLVSRWIEAPLMERIRRARRPEPVKMTANKIGA